MVTALLSDVVRRTMTIGPALGAGAWALYALSRHNYLLYHTAIEIFAVGVAITISSIGWHSRRFAPSNVLTVLSVGYLSVAVMDTLHMLAYKGMGVFPGYPASDLATQFWVAGRYVESAVLLLAVLAMGRKEAIDARAALVSSLVMTLTLIVVILRLRCFPACYVEGEGLTDFKIASELVVCAALVLASHLLWRRRRQLDRRVASYMLASLGLTIVSELSFMLYTDVYGFFNFLGHVFKLASFVCIHLGLVQSALTRPYEVIFRDLSRSESELRDSQERLQLALSAAEMGTWRWDPREDLDALDANLSRILGLDAVESVLPVEEVLDRIHPDDQASVRARIEEALRDRTSYSAELRIVRPDGTVRWLRDQGMALCDAGGDVLYMTGAVVDITDLAEARQALEAAKGRLEERVEERTAELSGANEQLQLEARYRKAAEAKALRRSEELSTEIEERREAEARLRESEAKFRTLVEQLPAIQYVAALDEASTTLYVSPQVTEILGMTQDEYKADPDTWRKALHPDDLDRVMAEVAKCHRSGEPFASEYRMIARDGTTVWFRDEASIIHGKSGRPSHLQGVMLDVSRRVQAEESLREAEKLAATGRMAARIAHEINNPLAGIRNAFRLVKDGIRADHPYHHYVGLIDREIDRISNIVRQMFEQYRTDAESPREFQAAAAVRDVVELLRTQAQEQGVALETDVSDAAVTIHQAEGRLKQALFSVIQNAIEASPHGGTVRIRTVAADHTLEITVTDEGPGIPPELQASVFEPFFSTKESSGTSGLGLGLAASRSAAESMGGRIELTSETGEGASFAIVLPTVQ